MRPYWITFGQVHVHSINDNTIDKDCVVEIQAEDEEQARDKAFEMFGPQFCFLKAYEPDMSYFPRGIIKIN